MHATGARRRWLGLGLLGCGAVLAGAVACGGDTFTNEPVGQGDGGAVDSGGSRDSGVADSDAGPREGCPAGASANAFCSTFDKSTRAQDDGWSLEPNGTQGVKVYNPPQFQATSGTNCLYVNNDGEDHAYVATSVPMRTKHFRLTFDLRMLEQGLQSYVAARVALCPTAASSNCYPLQFRFATSETSNKVYFEDNRVGTELRGGGTSAIDAKWSRIILDVNLANTASGIAVATVVFGQQQTVAFQPPSEILQSLDHAELTLGAVEAATGVGNGYVLAYDTVIFEPAL